MKTFLRAMREILQALLAFFALTAMSVLAAGLLLHGALWREPEAMLAAVTSSGAGNGAAAVLLIIAFSLYIAWTVRRGRYTLRELGLGGGADRAVHGLSGGFALGVLLICLEMAILLTMGQVSMAWRPLTPEIAGAMLWGLLLQAGVAFSEEITFRGYIQTAAGRKGALRGAAVSTVIFALLHLINTAYTPLSLLQLVMAGAILAFFRLGSDGLWLPVGFHLANNWTESCLWGYRAEEAAGMEPWLTTTASRSTVWNGMESGSGLVYLFLLAAVLAGAVWRYRLRRMSSRGLSE